ncbi:MAG: phosphotransferase [Thermoleophilia bacterium]
MSSAPPIPATGLQGGDGLLDPAAVAARLGVDGGDARVRYLEFAPGRWLMVQWRVMRDGRRADVVLTAGLPGPEVAWYPDDPGLPLLADGLAEAAARLGVRGAERPEVLAWVPRQRATLRAGDVVLKLYGDPAEAVAADLAMRRAAPWLGSPEPLGLDAALGLTAQTALPGRALGRADAVAVATDAGRLARRLHEAPLEGLADTGPAALLALCREAGDRVATALPPLADRVAAVLDALAAGLPAGLPAVPSHGDYTVGQMLDDGGRLRVVDTDTLCAAPAAHDLAAFAANLVSGRDGDHADALACLEAVCDGYGARPSGLDWYLAAAVMRRTDRALRRLKRDWPERTERTLAGVERLLAG